MIFFNEKKKYFAKKIDAVRKSIWDLEFKRDKTLTIKEEVRQTYDNTKSKIASIESQIELLKDDKSKKGDVANMKDDITRLQQDAERYEAQMVQLEMEVFGAKPSAENPQGVQGINHTIDAYQELLVMLQEYSKKI